MSDAYSHWGPVRAGGPPDMRLPVRTLVERELGETRMFLELVYRDFTTSGRRTFAASLVERGANLPWYLLTLKPRRLTSR